MIGLVKCGAWGCFDEFNRLEETTLSLISSQIHIIQEGLRTKSNSIVLLEKQVWFHFLLFLYLFLLSVSQYSFKFPKLIFY